MASRLKERASRQEFAPLRRLFPLTSPFSKSQCVSKSSLSHNPERTSLGILAEHNHSTSAICSRVKSASKDNTMKFRDLVNSMQSRWKESSVERRTERKLRAYRNSGEVLFPRLYGYRRKDSGIEVVESEAQVIRLILEMLSKGESVGDVKRHLDGMKVRNRSGNLFSRREILEIAKPAYAGLIQTRRGKWIKSAYYQPIVSVEILKGAQRAVQRLSEGFDFGLSALDGGVFLTLAR